MIRNPFITLLAVSFGLPLGCASRRIEHPVVAVLTDYGSSDAYVGVLSGAILSHCSDAEIVTITNEVPDFDTAAGSFLLGIAAPAFPAETVFCVVVDPGVGTQRRSVILRTGQGRLFVGPDNGTFTDCIILQGMDRAWVIDERTLGGAGAMSNTFHGRDIYGPVAGMLAAGRDPDSLGKPIDELVLLEISEPQRQAEGLIGEIRHVDGYGNLITNIPGAWLGEDNMSAYRKMNVTIGRQTRVFSCGSTYADVAAEEGVLLINSIGLLEIARNGASAKASFTAAERGSGVQISSTD